MQRVVLVPAQQPEEQAEDGYLHVEVGPAGDKAGHGVGLPPQVPGDQY